MVERINLEKAVVRRLRRFPPIKQQVILGYRPTFQVMRGSPATPGYWSRRITDEHRMVYRIEGNALLIAQLRFRY